ncbi:FeoA family protein [Desulfogranum japonicum]|uniref:FeoA family protein n=1 Tax=Desulfogranum japonicum TaxID=231447 RepID=UPI0004000145|nr:FeoA family protein [Desulfogranum japonicum]
MKTTLAEMAVGREGKVIGFASGSSAYRQKLLAMGMVKGTEFAVTRVAPMGDPVEITVRGYRLSLRKDEACALQIEELK